MKTLNEVRRFLDQPTAKAGYAIQVNKKRVKARTVLSSAVMERRWHLLETDKMYVVICQRGAINFHF